MTTPAPTRPAVHRERLWPSPAFWGTAPLLGVFVLVSLIPVDEVLAAVCALAVVVLVVLGLVRLSPVVEVSADGELRAGRARVPLAVVAGARAARGEDARRARGPELDARTHRCLRGWVDGVVVVDLDDPQDPTPSWIVSSRRPEQLAAAVERRAGRGAHTGAPR